MKIICPFIAVIFLITTHCFSDAVKDLLNENTVRASLYNATFSSTKEDLLGLDQLSEKTTRINNSLTKNVDKNKIATNEEKRIMLQAVFATEIIYGEARPSYLADVSEDDVIYGHYYVLEYSALLARDFSKFGPSSADVDAPEYKKLYSHCGLDKNQLFDWFREMFEKHRPGKKLRGQEVISHTKGTALTLSQNSTKHPHSSMLASEEAPNLNYTVLSAENCADYGAYVDNFNSFAESLAALSSLSPMQTFRLSIDIESLLKKKLPNFSAIKGNHFIYVLPHDVKGFAILGVKLRRSGIELESVSVGEGGISKFSTGRAEINMDDLVKYYFKNMPILTEKVTLFPGDTQKEFQDKLKLVFGESVMVLK